ncbi:hypothetical protein AGMMS49545_18740 [Betaproteobacteria bacterium]|nr:hypothetical protein AGMMS49545_18740 [Betaproteobacteria bacterium]GHU46310.1 hypothetical protein AGMMS50289_19410 [Betaproteobacteria bacterium]
MARARKIGVGIVTHKREVAFRKLLASIPRHKIDVLYVVNDATPYLPDAYGGKDITEVIRNPVNLGVGKSKNILLKKMMDAGCDALFLIEDDMEILDDSVFDEYINTAKVSGIGCLNCGIDASNRRKDGSMLTRRIVDYPGGVKIALYLQCLGQFSYFSRRVIERVGYMDEYFHNCWEHIEHMYRIVLAGFHPPILWFADVWDSERLLRQQAAGVAINTTMPEYHAKRAEAELWLKQKYGIFPFRKEFDTDEKRTLEILDFLKNTPDTPEYDAIRQQVCSLHPLVTSYCAGHGVELGRSSHNHFGLKNCLNIAPSDGVHYLCPQDIEDYRQHAGIQAGYGLEPAPVDKIGDTQHIPVEANSLNYILCSHVLEHEPNPIAALVEFSRALHENVSGNEGCLALVFSRRDAIPTDALPQSTLHSFINAYRGMKSRGVEAVGGGYYHVYSLQVWLRLINWCNSQGLTLFCIEALEENESKCGNGHTLILRKMPSEVMRRFDFREMISAYINDGQYDAALMSANISLSFDFFQPEILYATAMLLFEKGNLLEAREFYRQFLILQPENETGKNEFLSLFGVDFDIR